MIEVALAVGNSIAGSRDVSDSLSAAARELRRSKLIEASKRGLEGITLKLSYASALRLDAMIDFLGARAIRGIEAVENRWRYRLSIALDGGRKGVISVEPDDRERRYGYRFRFLKSAHYQVSSDASGAFLILARTR